jgi:hypothetical protein
MSADATPIEIFRAGRHVSAAGEEIVFTDGQVAAIAEAYDAGRYEAPLVIGHPATDAPAYGWVASLDTAGGTLRAVPRQVDPEFAEKVRAGRYKRVSAAFYRPDHPNNPRPGSFYLKHVGFLGAAAPAVKGLRPVEFVSDSDGVVEFAAPLQGAPAGLVARLFGNFREFLIAQFGTERADAGMPAWDIEALRQIAAEDAAKAAAAEPPLSYQEQKPMPDAPAPGEAAFAEREAAIADRERRLAEREAAARRAADAAVVDGLVTGGRLLPAQRAATLSFMAALDATEVVEFAEGDSATPHARFRDLLAASPRIVEFSEIAGGDAPEATDDPRELARKATEFAERERAAGRDINIAQAVQAVMKGGAL